MSAIWDNSLMREGKHPKNPSFSSVLLDEILRSIGECEEDEMKHRTVCYGGAVRAVKGGGGSSIMIEAEEMASLNRACLMEKLMEKKINDRVSYRRKTTSSLPELDNLISTTTSSSSSSSDSSSGLLSSTPSDAELFYGGSAAKASCFSAAYRTTRPNKAKAANNNNNNNNVPPRRPKSNNHYPFFDGASSADDYYLFDGYYNQETRSRGAHTISKSAEETLMIKSKSRAFKIYSNLKKVKQPISPGGRLTSFINSLFTGANKKSKSSSVIEEDAHFERKVKSTSATSTSRSSLMSQSAPNSRTKFSDDEEGVRRTVRFYPVSVIIDEKSRPCGHKSINAGELDHRYTRPPPHSQQSPASGGVVKPRVLEKNRNINREAARDVLIRGRRVDDDGFMMKGTDIVDNYEEEDEDDASDSSSDLFEIDHLEVFGNNRFCEELPVYESTNLNRNRAIY